MTFKRIQRMLAEILGLSEDQIAPDMRLNERGGVDAVSFAKLTMKCEQAFHITIHDEEAADFRKLSDLSRYVSEKRSEGRENYTLPDEKAREAWYYEYD